MAEQDEGGDPLSGDDDNDDDDDDDDNDDHDSAGREADQARVLPPHPESPAQTGAENIKKTRG